MIGLLSAILICLAICCAQAALGQEAEWIWSPLQQKDEIAPGTVVHFRKSFTMKVPEGGQVSIFADDQYELHVNGRKIATVDAPRKMADYDITRYLVRGTNVVAAKVTNARGKSAGLVARVTVKDKTGEWVSYSTGESWKSAGKPFPMWNTAVYNDRSWDKVQVFGELGSTPPWDQPAATMAEVTSKEAPLADALTVPLQATADDKNGSTAAVLPNAQRFGAQDEFEVQQVIGDAEAGSLIALTFNEFGHILASREGGPLLLVYDSNKDQIPDKVKTYCDQVKNCQGILALNGEVFVTADGPEGQGLYRLADKDKDGLLEDVQAILKFKCDSLEHGAHGLTLGPDGLIYVLLGNYASVTNEIDPVSPHRDYYDTDLLTPKYEDPGGHAVGVKAPGGTIIRTDAEGSSVQVVAGGLRNPYDLVFNREGDLFTHDADMESDLGTTWYRPTRFSQILPGGEYGWRSGWSNWPEYYVDSLPPVLDTGRGSPTGLVAYNHFMFPARYHGCVFTADWSQGKIMAVTMKKNGASYSASSEVFVEGNPLNVTDLDVGPDGWLYFTTGGRGTGGGIYRVVWKGTVPPEVTDLGTGITAVIRQPQVQSAWGRQAIAALRKQMGDQWDRNVSGVARSSANPPAYRLQALELMQLYGPAPKPELLITISQAPNELVRAKAAEMMGVHPSAPTQTRLIEMLADSDRTVRRKACEALSRADQAPPYSALKPMLVSDDRFEAWAARRLLERMPVEQWRDDVLKTENHRLLIEGGLTLLIAYPTRENSLAVLTQISQQMGKFISDRDFVDMLRLTEIALVRGEIKPEEIPGLRRQLAEEFPSGDARMNRELIRLLVYLQDSSIVDRGMEFLKSKAADEDKLHVAMHLRFLESGWTASQRMALLKFFEQANQRKGGGSYARYVIHATRDFTQFLSEEESRQVLAQGATMPNAALGALYKLPEKLDQNSLDTLKLLDKELVSKQGDSYQRLKVGIVATLARSGDESAFAYLREIWEQDPERRQPASLGLAQSPGGENWLFLVRSLPSLEPMAAREICIKLMTVAQAPEESDPYRTLILLALKAKDKDKDPSPMLALLQFWTDQELAAEEPVEKQLVAWQKWYGETYPTEPEVKLPPVAENSKYQFDQLLLHLVGEEGAKANRKRGEQVYAKAQCAKCHRMGDKGENVGPDLTTLAKRFTKKEQLESIIYPSQVISSQYVAKTVVTADGRTLTGIVAPGAGGEKVVTLATGERITVADNDILEIQPSKVSAMPSGLLEPLTLDEINDLFAYLQGSATEGVARQPGKEAK